MIGVGPRGVHVPPNGVDGGGASSEVITGCTADASLCGRIRWVARPKAGAFAALGPLVAGLVAGTFPGAAAAAEGGAAISTAESAATSPRRRVNSTLSLEAAGRRITQRVCRPVRR